MVENLPLQEKLLSQVNLPSLVQLDLVCFHPLLFLMSPDKTKRTHKKMIKSTFKITTLFLDLFNCMCEKSEISCMKIKYII